MKQQLPVMGDTMTEEDLIIHIINNLPKEYKNLTDSIELDLDDEFSKINI
jgi:gag-polypeptide of LTR copia-type